MIATHFSVLDWLIVVVYLALTLATGLYGRRFVGGISDFLVAGRELGTFIGIATLAATEIGTVTFMYYAELGYKTGYASFVNGLIAGLVMIVIGRTGFIVKRLRDLRLMTVPEFFEVKFSRRLRVFTGILVATGGVLNMGVFLKVEGTFLAIISGISLDHVKAVMTGILLLELVYTVLGGMVSIVITDFIQYVALSIGTILVTIWSINAAGLPKMYETVRETMGVGGFSPFANPEYGWAYVIFQVLIWLAVHTCWQTTAMRTFSTRSPEISKRVFSWAGFIYLGRGMMPMMWGIAALALLGPKQNSIEAMPRMLATLLPSGVLGLVVAGMLAATMSVNSSYLLGWSSIIAQDIILPLRRNPLSSRQQVMLNRGANLFVSAFVMIWGLWYTLPGPTYFYLNMTASIYLSGTLVAVIAGLFWSKANTLGGYLAMSGGAIATIAFFFFKTPASYAGLGAFILAGIGMVIGSLLGNHLRSSRGQPVLPRESTL
jgi:SSS family solute:Na+ symporter